MLRNVLRVNSSLRKRMTLVRYSWKEGVSLNCMNWIRPTSFSVDPYYHIVFILHETCGETNIVSNMTVTWLALLLDIRKGPGFKYRLGDRVPWPVMSFIFFVPSREISGYNLKLGHDGSIPPPFQFIIHCLSLHSTQRTYSLSFSRRRW
jgi:hypothetical protein